MGKPDTKQQMVVLSGRAVNEARKRLGLTIEGMSERAGVGYTTAWRSLHNEAMGQDLARKLCESLGLTLESATARDEERRPADGISPDAYKHFRRLVRIRLRQAIVTAHRETAAEAGRRCWFWPTRRIVQRRLSIREVTKSGEVVLL
jgi:transcriptional regulator with XRE-family HTH domain